MPLFSTVLEYIQTHTVSAVIQIVTTIPYSLAFWRKKKALLHWIVISSVFFTAGYLLEAAYDGVVISVCTLLVALLSIFLDKTENTAGVRTLNRRAILLLCILSTAMSLFIVKLLQQAPLSILTFVILLAAALHFTAFLLLKENGIAFSLLALLFQALLVLYECILFIPFFALLDIITLIIIAVRALSLLFKRGCAAHGP